LDSRGFRRQAGDSGSAEVKRRATTALEAYAAGGSIPVQNSGSDRKPESRCRRPETLVETDERPLLRTLTTPDQGRRELSGTGGTNAVRIRKIFGERPQLLGWENLVPTNAELPEQFDCGPAFCGGEVS
jgi:hypothetical protein